MSPQQIAVDAEVSNGDGRFPSRCARGLTDPSALVDRIRGEYREMPGLSLSLDQARRLWGLDERMCTEVLTGLVESGFLRRTPRGMFVKAAP